MKQLIISNRTREKKWAVIDHGKPERIELYPPFQQSKVGNIYSGTIATIKPSLQAAFVMFDHGPKGYLPLKAIPASYGSVHQGMRLLVQVKKDEEAAKGPVLTGDIELPGQYMVYFPFTQMIRISKKIKADQHKRLKSWAESLLQHDSGILMRTEAESADQSILTSELHELQQQYDRLNRLFNQKKGFFLINQHEKFDEDVKEALIKTQPDEIITDSPSLSKQLKAFVTEMQLATDVTYYMEDEDLFRKYLKEDLYHLMTRQTVWLDGGSSIAIDSLEALTVIDVNSSRQTGAKQQRAAVKEINQKAALESLRQMKLRDLHGIVLIDFINMESKRDQNAIDQLIREAAKSDHKHIHSAGFTELGLYQLTRKKTKGSYQSSYTVQCPVCLGKGHVLSPESCLLELEKDLLSKRRELDNAEIEMTRDIHRLIKDDPSFIKWIEEDLNIPVKIKEIEHIHPAYKIL
ncbi:ribonuclease E [Jeotgalibacillus malaysiensis]|uniref:Ribonuclease E n=1 Tax=Jeotgalibacillus malaysiensis TaxID=1508404 RepID=A0A0B5AMY4_9BACL|nr:ribonuclease E/G [Jeotgalibacillus malaysiensis]AJD91650.1 ribonuclease E [Jeotgalibacillus malaysiensis]